MVALMDGAFCFGDSTDSSREIGSHEKCHGLERNEMMLRVTEMS